MIADVMRLTQWEWFKLRRRWMPWILLGVAVLIGQMGFWFSYAAYHNETLQEFASTGGSSAYGMTTEVDGRPVSLDVSCVDLANGNMPPELETLSEEDQRRFLEDVERFRAESCANITLREDLRRGFTVPYTISASISGVLSIAAALVMILAASAIGSEYGWGTLRTALTRGTGRWQLLASKLVLLLLMSAAGFVLLAVAATAASLLAAVFPPEEAGDLADSGKWSDVAVTFGKALYGLAPYIALGAFLAVLTQSSAMGISFGMGYYVVELIASPIIQITDWGESVSNAFLGRNVNEWMETALVTVEVNGSEGSVVGQPDALQAFLVILAYTVVLAAAAFWVFQRRDIVGAKGG